MSNKQRPAPTQPPSPATQLTAKEIETILSIVASVNFTGKVDDLPAMLAVVTSAQLKLRLQLKALTPTETTPPAPPPTPPQPQARP